MDNDLISKLSEIRSEYNCFDENEEPYYRALSEAIKFLSRRADGDTVSREAVSEWLKQYGQDVLHGKYKFSLMYIWKNIMDLPSAQPETAKRIVGMSRDGMTLWYQCDMCNEPVDAQDEFCRGCGRRLTDE